MTEDRAGRPRPFDGWERRTRRWALILAGLTLLVSGMAAAVAVEAGRPLAPTLVLALFPPVGVYAWRTARIQARRTLLRQPFPAEWETILQRDVLFFRALAPDDQVRFRQELRCFLTEKRISGIGLELDLTTQVLVAASAIIPIFGFPDWEWNQIREVLVYADRFDRQFQFGDGQGKHILGMVGTGSLNGLMILSKPDLIAGFRNAADKRNVGLHEVAHLVDKSDGAVDGIPRVGLEPAAIGPWVDLIRRKMTEIARGGADLDRYALTSEAEFFAVATEYFFERPGVMRRKHPELYAALEGVFNQNLGARLRSFRRELTRPRRKLGRNSPCPCGSGQKFKRCCLRRSA